jgi:cytoskeletal protein RodZ
MSESNLPDRSIGKKLKDQRYSLELSLADVSRSTKIRTEYLEALESDDFTKFDSHVYAKGFIRNYALFLKLDPAPLIALYRRDFENINNKRNLNHEKANVKDEKKDKAEVKITKQKIAYVVVSVIFIFFIVTLFVFLQNTFKPPKLVLTNPEVNNEPYKFLETESKSIRIEGQTEAGTLIKINEEPVAIKPGFTFLSDFLPLTSDNNIIEVEAISQLGIKTTIQLEIVRTDLKNKDISGTEVLILVREKPIFLLVRSDGEIKFNDIAVPNEAINITADKFIEIETSEPKYVSVQINSESFQLEKSFERFEFGEKIKRLNQ